MRSEASDEMMAVTLAQTEPNIEPLNVMGNWAGDLRAARLWWSPECGSLPSECGLRGFARALHRDDRRSLWQAIRAGMGEPGLHRIAYRARQADGSLARFVSVGRVYCDERGRPVSVGGATLRQDACPSEAPTPPQDGLQALLGHAREGVGLFDSQGRLSRWNACLADALGLPADFLFAGASFALLLLPIVVCGDFGEGDALQRTGDLQARLLAGGAVRLRRCGPGGALELRGHALADGGFVVFVAELGIDTQHERLLLADTVLGNSPFGFAFVDSNGLILDANPALALMTGYAAAELRGRAIATLTDGEDSLALARVAAGLDHRAAWQGEIAFRKKSGDSFAAMINVVQVEIGESVGTRHVWIISDISDSKRAAEQVYQLAHQDALTGLANRLALQLRLDQALPEARRRSCGVAVLFIDLDRFKIINDTLGHVVGDRLLGEVACRLQRVVRESDLVARLGGDEFVILLPDVENASDAAAVAGKVLAAFARPVLIDANELHTSPSIGISLSPSDGSDGDTLLRNADAAMYHAKASGRNNYQFFAAEMNQAANQRLDLERKLRHALAHGEFTLAFQPQLRAGDQVPVGVEALVRWNHPRDGAIPPSLFIPVAEETGLIVALGEWVLRNACQTVREWMQAGLPPLKVAVNVSARQLRRRDFLEMVAGILVETDLPAEQLELEITESVAMENPEESIRLLRAIRQMGVSIAIDDFGTGYSSLAYLKLLPIDYLKIDRSFVADIEFDLNDRAIAFGTIALAHSLGLGVIAEGVETADQLELLRSNGCDQIQGYYFSKPLATEAAMAYLQRSVRA